MAPSGPGEGPSRSFRAKETRARTYSPPSDRTENPPKRSRTVGARPDAEDEPTFLDDDAAIYSQLVSSVSNQRHRAANVPNRAEKVEDESLGINKSAYCNARKDDVELGNKNVSIEQEEAATNNNEASQAELDDAMDIDQDELPNEDNGDSQTSILSLGYYGDLTSDMSIDLDNLVGTYVIPQSTGPKGNDISSHLEQATPFSREDSRDLRHTLRKWLDESTSNRTINYFCYQFQGRHPPTGFSALDLTGRDLALLKTFIGFVEEMPMEIFLVVLERSSEANDVSGDDFLGRTIVDIQGRVLATHVPLENVISLSSLIPTGTDGGSDNSSETALLFVHRDYVADFFMNAAQDHRTQLPPLLQYFAEKAAEPETRDRLLFMVQDLFWKALDIHPVKGLSYFPVSLEQIFRSMVLIGDWEWFDLLASHAHGAIPLKFFSWARKMLIKPGVPFNDPEKAMQSAALSYPDVHMQCAAIWHFVGSPPGPETCSWARSAVSRVMERVLEDVESSELGEKDGSALVRLVGTYRNMKGLEEFLPQLVEKNSKQISFILGVINELHKNMSVLPKADALIEQLGRWIIEMDIATLASTTKAEDGTAKIMPHIESAASLRRGAISPDQLASFVDAMLATKANDALLMHFSFKIVVNAGLLDEGEMKPLWLPFVRRLMDIADERNVPSFTRRLRFIAEAILEAFCRKALGTKPPREWRPTDKNWFCACPDCGPIRAFLASDCLVAKLSVRNLARPHIIHVKADVESKLSCQLYEKAPDLIIVRKIITREAGALDAWEKARRHVEEELGQFDREKLEKLVGSPAKILEFTADDPTYDSDDTILNAPFFEGPPTEPPIVPWLPECLRTGPAPTHQAAFQQPAPLAQTLQYGVVQPVPNPLPSFTAPYPPHAANPYTLPPPPHLQPPPYQHPPIDSRRGPDGLVWQTPYQPGFAPQHQHYQRPGYLQEGGFQSGVVLPPPPKHPFPDARQQAFPYPSGPLPQSCYEPTPPPSHTLPRPVTQSYYQPPALLHTLPRQESQILPPLNPSQGPPPPHRSAAGIEAHFGNAPVAAQAILSPLPHDIARTRVSRQPAPRAGGNSDHQPDNGVNTAGSVGPQLRQQQKEPVRAVTKPIALALPSPKSTPRVTATAPGSLALSRRTTVSMDRAERRAEPQVGLQLAPAAGPPVAPEDELGFKNYFDEVSPGIRRAHKDVPEDWIKNKLTRQWNDMPPRDRETYATARSQPAETPGRQVDSPTPSASVRSAPRILGTPIKREQIGRVVSSGRNSQSKGSVSTSSSPSRVLMERSANIASQGVKRKLRVEVINSVEVIDLTLHD
ncbi:hypothetical protein QBC34DRAFT_57469 [Podospora aff. communis PSN243]|uniref:HMG box domain-containing protein n=1 Tax=Podospora aff. communis PSN243 TaxID=3040156 RepID=A0AAV9GU98_9PEZI|nr:hypothetical protein QBC34DRAFT_57469 [Podospora aff. communis PSN243]